MAKRKQSYARKFQKHKVRRSFSNRENAPPATPPPLASPPPPVVTPPPLLDSPPPPVASDWIQAHVDRLLVSQYYTNVLGSPAPEE